MAAELSADEKLALLKSQLQEVLKFEIIEEIVRKGERPLCIYWGSATTGRPHCGYFVPMVKLAHFLRAGFKVKILLADIHGFLDNLKAPIELVNFRAEYYRYVIESLMKTVGVSTERLEFVLGSSYQLSSKYTMDLFRLSSMVTEHDAKKAGAEVVKQVDNAPLSGLIYPLMQALDEEHLGVDAQFGGVDQRKIFTMAQEQLPRIGYRERAHMMNPMVPGLAGGKMSASDPDSKVDVLDTPDQIRKKIKKAFAAPKTIEGNGLISFIEYVLLPVSGLQHGGAANFTVERKEGDPLVFKTIEEVKAAYEADTLTPQLLKSGVAEAIVAMLMPIQEAFQASKEWQEVEKKAYPPPPEPAKKKKKEKKIGTRFAEVKGGSAAVVKPDGSLSGEADTNKANVGAGAEEAMEKLAVGQEK